MGFTKLDDAFASSSIFSLGLDVVGFWAYLMSQADSRGRVTATVPDMAARCRVTPERVEEFLSMLQQPDRWSRTPDNEGRRVEVVREPEWAVILLNHGKYRERDHSAAERQRRHRASRTSRRDSRDVTPEAVTSRKQKTEAEAETEGRKESHSYIPPTQRAEQAVNDTVRSLHLRLGELICKLSEHPNSRRMVPDWSRAVTSYDRQDGTKVRGVPDWRTIYSIDRLERSIADAEWHLAELEKGGGDGT